MNWFEKRRYQRALKTLQERGKLTYHEFRNIVKPRSADALIYALSWDIAVGKLRPRYDRVSEGILVESKEHVYEFSPAVCLEEIEITYIAR